MRVVAALLTVTLAGACAQKEEAPPPPPTPAAPTLADFAGTWQVKSVMEGTPDTVRSTMTGTADAASWTIALEGRPNVAVTVSLAGDSLVGQTAEYESVLQKGVMVSVRTASVMMDGMLHGNLTATYKTPTGDQVVKGTMTATKAP